MIKNKYVPLLIVTLLLFSCNGTPNTELEEDYEQLFPFTGISKPETSYEDMNVTPCDPDVALSNYQYPGVTITEEVREYEVTIRCRYDQQVESHGSPNFMVRYIAPDKTMKLISSNKKNQDADVYMEHDKELVLIFKVHSGYPLYLSVSGSAPRGSSITAEISAHSLDGFIVVPSLKTTQSQNKEGTNLIPSPYCEYIILP